MTTGFKKATKVQKKLRGAIVGASGTGKTFSALKIAKGLGERIALIDTEEGSSELYADDFDFDVLCLTTFSPNNYIEAIKQAEAAGYDVLIIDSLSHAWNGEGGVLDIKNRAGDSFQAWAKANPHHFGLIKAIKTCRMHVIVTMRAKTEYVLEEYIDQGKKKTKPVKIGLAPVQRDGLEYEFDVIGMMDHENVMSIDKTRCSKLKGLMFREPGDDVAAILREWLSSGAVNRDDAEADLRAILVEEKKQTGSFGITINAEIVQSWDIERLHAETQAAKDRIKQYNAQQQTSGDLQPAA